MNSRNTLYIKYFRTIILTILAPMLICSFITYGVCLHYTKVDTGKALSSVAENSVKSLEQLIEDTRKQVIQLAMELENDELIVKPNITLENKLYNLKLWRKKLEGVASINPNIDVVALHLLGDEKILCHLGYYDLETYIDKDGYEDLMSRKTTSGYFFRSSGRNEFEILVSQCVPIIRTEDATVIYASIPEAVVHSVLNSEWNEAEFIIAQKDGTVLFSTMDEPIENAAVYFSSKPTQDANGYYGAAKSVFGGEYSLIALKSTIIAEKNMAWLKNLILTLGATALLSSAFCAFLLAKKFYKPIRKLTDMAGKYIKSMEGYEVSQPGNEFAYLGEIIREFSEYSLSLKRVLTSSRINAICGMLRHIIIGNHIAEGEMNEIMESSGFRFAPAYTLLLLEARELMDDGLADETLLRYQTEKTIRKVFGMKDAQQCFTISMKANRTCIVFEAEENESAPLKEKCEYLINHLRIDLPGYEFAVGIGGNGSYKRFHEMYKKAAAGMIFGGSGVFFVEEGQAAKEFDPISEKELKNFIRGLNDRDEEEAEQAVSKWIDDCVSGEYQSVDMLREKCMQILGCAITIAGEVFSMESKPAFFAKIADIANLEDFKKVLGEFGSRLVEASAKNVSQRSPNLLMRALEYVNTNYDKDISLTGVADFLKVTPQYLSSIFKKAGKETFTDYLNRLRLEKACVLLRSTDRTLEEISQEVGYNSSQYFVKKFKTEYGITPSRFRNSENVNIYNED